MPHRTERSLVLKDLEHRLAARTISTSIEMVGSFTDSDEDSNNSSLSYSGDELLLDSESIIYNSILSHRYFSERHPQQMNSSRMANDLLHINPIRFKARFKMSPIAFQRMWNMIKDHDIFKNRSATLQFDPRLQFLVVLFRFGVYRNGASRANIAETFHISTGVISKFTKRIIVALLLLEKSSVSWPTNVEKDIIKQSIEESHGFTNVVGIMDGTHIILSSKSSNQGEQYFNQKSRYSISCMIVNDQNCKITHLQADFPGSTHDSRVFVNSQIWLKHNFFKDGEYLLVDSGYPLTAITIPPYKQPASNTRENQRFNRHLSSIRVKSEHTIGQLKGRFQSLRGIPTVIDGKHTHTLVVLWIRSCGVLHNLLLEDGYDLEWEGGQEDLDRIVSDGTSNVDHQTLPYNDAFARRKRERIKSEVLHYHGDA